MRVRRHDCRHNDRVFPRGACGNARRVSLFQRKEGRDSVISEGITFAVAAIRDSRADKGGAT